MLKATFFSTIFVAVAIHASADSSHTHDLSNLPSDVAARVIELQKYGDRFEAAINGILAEAMKPSWTFDGCGHESSEIQQGEPQS